ncbi:hypothetical protein [Luteibacter yeojuensis]|uniref:Uncharacterized protein n=1 Tax=Luteibacter yeojuensis TaxID=345309 RepID=A0A0F3L2L0_9GAMM|nr:hypothetical protein [Luteibacter yeojuensis]KJV36574.1 hypothetical protein VI08_04305 [Luteibacter yeojuensis]
MHTVNLTVLIDDPADIDMEVRVVAPDTTATAASATVTPLKPRNAPAIASTADDDYTLGGYAGI